MEFLLSVLRGLGQIMLQRNAATGVGFVLAIAINSPLAAFAAFLGSVAGTALAWPGKFPPDEIRDGLYGFNAALVGIATVHFYPVSILAAAAGICGIVFATGLMRAMQLRSLNPYTFPFVLTVWLMFLLIPPGQATGAGSMASGYALADGFLQAFGQVMFQGNSLTGLVFLVAILINSTRCAGFAALGAAVAVVTAAVLDWPVDRLVAGIHGYNAVLSAIALALVARRPVLPLIGIALSIVITRAFLVSGVPALTFPFVLATWIVLIARRFVPGEAR